MENTHFNLKEYFIFLLQIKTVCIYYEGVETPVLFPSSSLLFHSTCRYEILSVSLSPISPPVNPPPSHPTCTLVGLYSSLLSSRSVPLECWGWSPHSLAQTTLSGSSLAFRARWTADMTCTRPTRWRSTPWRPTRWALMDDLGQW